jgi:hypothetical protein
VVVRDTRYHAPDSELAPTAEIPVVNINVEPVTETKIKRVSVVDKKMMEGKSKIKEDRFQLKHKNFLGLNQTPFLLSTDSKLVKIRGNYKGILKFLIPARTGESSIVNLSITEKETAMTVMDAYDNIDANYTFSRSTSEVFMTHPEDENLIMLNASPENSFIFDLRDLPKLKGKAFVQNILFGDVELKKKQEEK